MNTNKQMSLEDFKKAVMKELMNGNYTIAEKKDLQTKIDDNLEIYLEDNLTPQETVQALRMGY